jgi:glycosyltransferase involved in cell wall biosynthesis
VSISLIIPVFNGAATLPSCLRSFENSNYRAGECIVIDDGSTDDSASIAERAGAIVLSTGGRFGPARARNLGAGYATGDILVFLDADVTVHQDTLGRIAERFEAEPELDALIGAYDDCPADPAIVSQFRNLMHAFVHRSGERLAFTFWCGCGAVRRSVYLDHGGLDESYRRASIEDIELGFRMMASGRKIVLDPQVQCKHLKVWTLLSMVRTDVLLRGIPWTELILRTRYFPDDLNLRWSQRVSVVLTFLLVALGGLQVLQVMSGRVLMPASTGAAGILASLMALCVLNRSFYQFLAARKGWRFLLAALPMHILYFVCSGIAFAAGARSYGFRFFRSIRSEGPAPRGALEDGKKIG